MAHPSIGKWGVSQDHGVDTMIADNDGIAVFKSNYSAQNIHKKHKTLKVDRTHLDCLFKTELDSFNEMEVQYGAAGPTRSQHRTMIYTCLAVLETKTRRIILDRITKNDIDYIQTELEYHGKSPTSHVRVFAAFLSHVTGREPLIPLGGYGKTIRTGALIVGKILVGTKADQRMLDDRFKAELDSFSSMEETNGMSSHTRYIHRTRVIGCLYLLGDRDIDSLDSHDIDTLETRLADIGAEVGRYITPFVSFVSHLTGDRPLRDVGQSRARPKWCDGYSGRFRYPKELETYGGFITARGVQAGTVDVKTSHVTVAM